MSDIQRIDSPDHRFFLLLASSEMCMSHWVTSAALWAAHPQQQLLEIGDWQWISEQIAWSADSRRVTIGLRRYPGDAPGTEAQLTVMLEQTYQQLTGAPLSNHDPVFVERYSHSGMSSGYVSPPFWAETAIPLL